MIDVSQPGSPGWYLARNAKLICAKRKTTQDLPGQPGKPGLDLLASYACGSPPLPQSAEGLSFQFREFMQLARANYYELVSESVADRTTLMGFRTAAAKDEDGDARAAEIMSAGFDVESSEVVRKAFNLGESYAIVGDIDDETGLPTITTEDPRQVVTVHDPLVPQRVLSALKLYHDDDRGQDRAYVYLRGTDGARATVHVASRKGRGSAERISPQAWSWDEQLGGEEGQTLPFTRVPVVRYRNKDGKSECETHLRHLDRINFWLFQCMIIALHQAHRQLAFKGQFPDRDPLTQELINYDDLFRSDPGAVWRLPEGADVWQSQQTDLLGLASLIDKDVQRLAAVTRTPLFYLTADAANGSAEGASLSREALIFKARDRIARVKQSHRLTMSLAFEWLASAGGPNAAADRERAQISALEPIMAPPEQFSLNERADAGAKAAAAGVPWATNMTDVWQFTPADVRRMRVERMAEQFEVAANQIVTGGQQAA